MNGRSFRMRAFVSYLLALAFLLSAVSGIVLFLRPEGSLAAWTGWSALGIDKRGWEELHAAAVSLFLLAALLHLAYNARALLAFARRRASGMPAGRRELVAALLLFGLLLAAFLTDWRPLGRLAELRAWFKDGAGGMRAEPPVADAGMRTLAELCPLLGMDEARLLAAARNAGIRVESLDQTLAEVAGKNGVSPEEAFIRLTRAGKSERR